MGEYPKKIVLSNGDTVIAITPYQLKEINKRHSKSEGLLLEIKEIKKRVGILSKKEKALKDKIELVELNSLTYKQWIVKNELEVERLKKERDKFVKAFKKMRRQRNFAILGGIVLSVLGFIN